MMSTLREYINLHTAATGIHRLFCLISFKRLPLKREELKIIIFARRYTSHEAQPDRNLLASLAFIS